MRCLRVRVQGASTLLPNALLRATVVLIKDDGDSISGYVPMLVYVDFM